MVDPETGVCESGERVTRRADALVEVRPPHEPHLDHLRALRVEQVKGRTRSIGRAVERTGLLRRIDSTRGVARFLVAWIRVGLFALVAGVTLVAVITLVALVALVAVVALAIVARALAVVALA